MDGILACAVCMGPPGHETSQAIGYAILGMLAFLLPVLLGFVGLMVHLIRKSREYAALHPDELDLPSS